MKRLIMEWKLVLVLVAVMLVLWRVSPSKAAEALASEVRLLQEMLLILPPVFALIGLLDVWVPRETVVRNVGRHSGARGLAISILLGSATVGPLYAAFPIASALLKKGASVMNVVAFLTAKAAAEIPLVAVEAKFLGLSFALLRLGLTLVSAPLIGWIVERAVVRGVLSDLPVAEDESGV